MTNAAELNQQFLEEIIPATGNIVVCPGKKSKGIWTDFTDPVWREKFLQANRDKDVYYSPASYQGKARKQDEAVASCVLFMDIDAGEVKQAKHGKEKVYDNWKHALNDILEWVAWAKVPAPSWIIRSGEGLHLYWVSKDEMNRAMWEPLQRGLMRKAVDGDVKVDGAVGSMNELLRLPGGIHQASGHTVEILENQSTGVQYDYLDLCRYFPPVDSATASAPGALGVMPAHLQGEMDDTWFIEQPHAPRSFRKLLERSLNGEGCAFVAMGYTDQAKLAEEPWRAMLSLAINCDDGAEMIHEISNKHPEYSASETEKKADYVVDKPYRCVSIENLCPGICNGCPHKVKSPITLANTIDTSNLVSPAEHRQKILREKKALLAPATDSKSSARRVVAEKIADLDAMEPVFPDGYALTPSGKLLKHQKDGEPVIIYDRPFYLVERLKSDGDGDMLLMHYESPQDGIREVSIPQTALSSNDVLLKLLAKVGILSTSKFQDTELPMFLKKSALEMQQRKARDLRHNFGWQGHTDSFVHGRHEFTSDGEIHLTSVAGGDSLVEAMQPMDDADPAEWGRLAQQFMMKGFEPGMFAIGLSLGAPLFKLANMQGGLVHLYSAVSGRGKTTAMRTALSVWGRTQASSAGSGLMCIANDTENAIYGRLAALGSIPTGIDELTDKREDELRRLLYSITQGRQRDRLEGQSNTLRTNTGTWQMAVMSTGNTSITERMGTAGDMRDAVLARMLELDCEHMPVLDLPPGKLDEWLSEVEHHHAGIVGRMVSYFITKNKDALRKNIQHVQDVTLADLKFSPKERFWRGMMVCALSGLQLGSALGLFRFDEKIIIDYFASLLGSSRAEQREALNSPKDMIADFLSDHIADQLVVPTEAHVPNELDIPKSLVSKFVRETETLYISQRAFLDWATQQKMGTKQAEKYLTSLGATTDRVALIPGESGRESRIKCWIVPNYKLASLPPREPTSEEQSYIDMMERSR